MTPGMPAISPNLGLPLARITGWAPCSIMLMACCTWSGCVADGPCCCIKLARPPSPSCRVSIIWNVGCNKANTDSGVLLASVLPTKSASSLYRCLMGFWSPRKALIIPSTSSAWSMLANNPSMLSAAACKPVAASMSWSCGGAAGIGSSTKPLVIPVPNEG